MAKPSLAVLIGMKKPTASRDMKDDDDAPESGDDVSDAPHVDAAHEVMKAVKSGDAEALSDALKVFYDLCKNEHSDEEY